MIRDNILRRSATKSRVGARVGSQVGVVVLTPKAPGDPTHAEWTMQHKGPGGRFWAGIGIFPRGATHADPSDPGYGPDVWLGQEVDIVKHGDFVAVRFTADGPWPAGYIGGTYDVLKIIVPAGEDPISRQQRGVSPSYLKFPNLDDDWDDDVFNTIPTSFRFIEDATHVTIYS